MFARLSIVSPACAAAFLVAGCANANAVPPAAGSPAFARSIAVDDAAFLRATGTVVVAMNEGFKRETVPPYGNIFAYAKGKTSTKSQIVHALPGQNIVFTVTDTKHIHSAALLGAASGTGAPWPSAFDGSKTASPPGTAIGTAGWATGPIGLGTSSATYSAGAAGYYMIGCQFHYQYGMRTIVIVR